MASTNPSPWRNNGRKPQSHCGKGHEYTAENITLRPNRNTYECKQCARLRSIAYYERQKARQREA